MSSSRRSNLSRLLLAGLLILATAGCGEGGLSDLGQEAQVFVVSADGRRLVRVTHDDAFHSSPAWSPDGGRLAFLSSGALETVRANGTGRRMLWSQSFLTSVSWSPDGKRFAFSAAVGETRTRIGVIGADGSSRRVISTFIQPRGTSLAPTWSPDAMQVAYGRSFGTGPPRVAPGAPPGAPAVLPGTLKIVVSDFAGRRERRLTTGSGDEWDPRWSPNGTTIVFMRGHAVLLASPVRPDTQRLASGFIQVLPEWSPNGRRVALAGVRFAGDRRYHLWVLALKSRRLTELADRVGSARPSWSPDGRRLAFVDRAGLAAVRVHDGSKQVLRRVGDAQIREVAWSPDGRWIAFTAARVPAD